jgi:hypothetical protein
LFLEDITMNTPSIYSQKFELVEKNLILECKNLISTNYLKMFDMWLLHEADMEFGYTYQDTFKSQFQDYITEENNNKLWLSAKNLIYAIYSFIDIKKDKYILEDLLEFVEIFITKQLDGFDNDYETTTWFNEDNAE